LVIGLTDHRQLFCPNARCFSQYGIEEGSAPFPLLARKPYTFCGEVLVYPPLFTWSSAFYSVWQQFMSVCLPEHTLRPIPRQNAC